MHKLLASAVLWHSDKITYFTPKKKHVLGMWTAIFHTTPVLKSEAFYFQKMIYCIKEHGTWVSRYNDMIYLLRAIGLPPTHLHINNT